MSRAGTLLRLTVIATTTFAATGVSAVYAETIKIGEINSYKAQPAFLGPYKNGWNLALDEINAAGGVAARSSKSSRATTTATPATRSASRRN